MFSHHSVFNAKQKLFNGVFKRKLSYSWFPQLEYETAGGAGHQPACLHAAEPSLLGLNKNLERKHVLCSFLKHASLNDLPDSSICSAVMKPAFTAPSLSDLTRRSILLQQQASPHFCTGTSGLADFSNS